MEGHGPLLITGRAQLVAVSPSYTSTCLEKKTTCLHCMLTIVAQIVVEKSKKVEHFKLQPMSLGVS